MKKKNMILLAALMMLAVSVQGAPIFTQSGPDLLSTNSIGGMFDAMLFTGWTQNFASANTRIDVFNLDPFAAGTTPDVIIELRDSSATGTVRATQTITLGAASNFIVFQNLLLPAGTYYLAARAATPTAADADATWTSLDNISVNNTFFAAPGVTAAQEYFTNTGFGGALQASDMFLGFSVAGDATAIPEPASMLLIGLGLAGLGLLRRRLS